METLAELRTWPAKSQRSPIVLFPHAARLTLRLPSTLPTSVKAVHMLLSPVPIELRQRITHVTIKPMANPQTVLDLSLDYLQIVEALNAHLPGLQSLEFDGCLDLRLPAAAAVGRRLGPSPASDSRLPSIIGAVTAKAATTQVTTSKGTSPHDTAVWRGLQRLSLPGLTCAVDLVQLAAGLAALPHLRELTLTTCGVTEASRPRLTEAGVAALGRLTALERLSLDCLPMMRGCSGGAPSADRLLPLQLLLGAQRPPRLERLKLTGQEDQALTVSYQRGLPGAGPGWSISRVLLQPPRGRRLPSEMLLCLDATAAVLLAAAEALGQRQLPELVIPRLCVDGRDVRRHGRQLLEPEGALPRLVARCDQVQLGQLQKLETDMEEDYGMREDEDEDEGEGGQQDLADGAGALLPVVRVLGMPRVLHLHHGQFQAASGVITAAAPDTAAARGQQSQLLAEEQPRPQKRQRPEQVMCEALDRLWASAVRSQQAVPPGSVASIRRRGGREHGEFALLVLRSSCMPRLPWGAGNDGGGGLGAHDCCPYGWSKWLSAALTSCLCGGDLESPNLTPEIWRRFQRLLKYCSHLRHVAVPGSGVVLLEWDEGQHALELAELMACGQRHQQEQEQQQWQPQASAVCAAASAASAASESGGGRAKSACGGNGGDDGGGGGTGVAVMRVRAGDHGSSSGVLAGHVLQVLTDMWARGDQTAGTRGHASLGAVVAATSAAGSSAAGAFGGGDAPGSIGSGPVVGGGEELQGRLGRLVALDSGVQQLWTQLQLLKEDLSDCDSDLGVQPRDRRGTAAGGHSDPRLGDNADGDDDYRWARSGGGGGGGDEERYTGYYVHSYADPEFGWNDWS
ncbi:hypothetical protein HYH02_011964 [Chlamydomonas schloesseri]|uniref:Uncharacterized protein n=1 Tax=Chlamydomonas schloesseri TaxID=2026947 RepID=A0A835W396_9CHLO|nr:hypothetical protein HYH02_011964 [Chlamydomonas schloesseri]|eukprot:KAG2435464.1 hypothetical protein HYH02_011964 [Chlamydomonas schloesseri]